MEGWEIVQHEIEEANYRELNAISEQNALIAEQNRILAQEQSKTSNSSSSSLSFRESCIAIAAIISILIIISFKNTLLYFVGSFGEHLLGQSEIDKRLFIVSSIFLIIVVLLLVKSIAFCKIFKNAGEFGLIAFIPIFNLYYLCKIADGNGWKFLLFIFPVINIGYYFYLNLKLAKRYNRSTAFKVGLIFLNSLFLLFLGFGKKRF